MPRSVRFHPAALQDAEEAAVWYAERSVRAAVRFLDELDRLIVLIAISPNRFQVFDADLRRAVFRRFPFYIVFRADDLNIAVLAVAHGKETPSVLAQPHLRNVQNKTGLRNARTDCPSPIYFETDPVSVGWFAFCFR